MASAARELEYRGSVAYDLSRFDKRKRVREALENEPVAAPSVIRPRGATKAKEEARASAKARARGISAFTAISYIAIFSLFMMVIMNYMTINELSVEQSALSSELAELKNDAAQLKVKYEQKLNLHNIEEQAAERGLNAPTSDQIRYIDISGSDRAVVYAERSGGSSFLAGLQSIYMSVVNFFE